MANFSILQLGCKQTIQSKHSRDVFSTLSFCVLISLLCIDDMALELSTLCL